MNRRKTFGLTAIAALILLVGGPARAATRTAAPQPRPVAMQQYDQTLDATFSMGVAPDGSAWTEVRAGDLTVDKVITAAGQAAMTLNYRSDHVTFRLTSGGYSISRGKRSARLSQNDQNEDHRTALRDVLLGSQAVRAFRAFTAALERRDDNDTAAVVSTLVDGALVAMLDGDEGAVDRMGRRATRRARANTRQASATAEFNDCVGNYERALMFAFNEFESCMNSATEIWWWSPIYTPFCSLEYFGRSQQYIYQFIACFAIP